MLRRALRIQKSAGDLWRGVEAIDRSAVRRRVAKMRKSAPDATTDELHDRLLYAKCLETGAIGAVSSFVGILPGVGRVARAVLGPLADAALVSVMQAELVAETLALYEIDMPKDAERMAVLAIAATNIGAGQIGQGIAQVIAQRTSGLLGKTLARGAAPLVNVVAVAATNIAVTYAIGKRTQALCRMKDAQFEQWPDLLRAVTMIDERRLVNWASRSAQSAFDQAGQLARRLGGSFFSGLSELGALGPTPPARKPRAATKRKPAAKKSAPAKTATRRRRRLES